MRKHDETAENLHAVLLLPFALIKLGFCVYFQTLPVAGCAQVLDDLPNPVVPAVDS